MGALGILDGSQPSKRRTNYNRGHRLPVDCGLRAPLRYLAGQVLQPKAPGGAPKENPLLRPGQPGSILALRKLMDYYNSYHNSSFSLSYQSIMSRTNSMLYSSTINANSDKTHLSLHAQPSFSTSCFVRPTHFGNTVSRNFSVSGCPNSLPYPLSMQPISISTNYPQDPEPNIPLLRPRSPFKLGSFNVRTLMPVSQQVGLARTLETLGIDVCCLSETRFQDESTVMRLTSPSDSTTHYTLRFSGDPAATASGQAGVGIALSARAASALLDWIPIDSRLCAARISGSCKVGSQRPQQRALFVISAYAPTDCSSEATKDQFYQRLHALLLRAPRSDIVVLAGDMNARIGRLTSDEACLGGSFSLDGVRSDNGDRFLTLCSDHNLFITSSNFRRSRRRLATWRPPSPTQAWSQIDHIAISYRWRGSVQNCRSYWTTCVDSDHALLMAKISLRFGGRAKSSTCKTNIQKLSDPAVLSAYQTTLAANLVSPRRESSESHWAQLQSAMCVASLTSCGQAKQNKNRWISANSLQLLDARKELPADSAHNETRLCLKREITKSLKADHEAWWCDRASEMEVAASTGNFRALFQVIRATGARRKGVSEIICEIDNTRIHNLQRRLARWAEHFQLQFNWPAALLPLRLSPHAPPWPVSIEPPTEAEIRRTLDDLKRHKAPGPDEISPALFKDGGIVLVRELTHLFSTVWLEETVPSSWNVSTIAPIFKKGARNDCANHRGISLISIAPKLLASLMLHRLYPHREESIREEQAGFRAGRGCIDQIFALRQILEHRHLYQQPTIVVFLDIRAAFDSIDRARLWDCLSRSGVPDKYVRVLKALYYETSAKVKAYGELSQPFSLSSGVRQGCPISPFLFNFAVDDILCNAIQGSTSSDGVELLPGYRTLDMEYADDVVLVSQDTVALQDLLNHLAVEVSRYGMFFAPSKCKVLSQDWQGPLPPITLGSDRLEEVDRFVYLGSCITPGGGVEGEASLRIAKARSAFNNLKHLWRRHDVSLSLKGRVYKATVRAVLLYGCETWPIRTEDVQRLSVFDNRCLRAIARVWWQQRVTNREVRQRVLGLSSPPLESYISQHRMRWLGHVLRMSSARLPFRALFTHAKPHWKKRRGGQPMTWRRSMKNLTLCLSKVGPARLPGWGPKDCETLWLETLKDMAQCRTQWKTCSEKCVDTARITLN